MPQRLLLPHFKGATIPLLPGSSREINVNVSALFTLPSAAPKMVLTP